MTCRDIEQKARGLVGWALGLACVGYFGGVGLIGNLLYRAVLSEAPAWMGPAMVLGPIYLAAGVVFGVFAWLFGAFSICRGRK